MWYYFSNILGFKMCNTIFFVEYVILSIYLKNVENEISVVFISNITNEKLKIMVFFKTNSVTNE